MTGTRQCSLSIQSLPTASDIARGTEYIDGIRRDSIPFRMHDISYCKPVLQKWKVSGDTTEIRLCDGRRHVLWRLYRQFGLRSTFPSREETP
jgi:hypothetical protein